MRLPNDSIGISDVLAWRDCPRRMSYSMRRHTGPGEQSDAQAPEEQSWQTAYGSAAHDVIHHVEDGYDDDAAITRAWATWGSWLLPGDLVMLKEDLEKYRTRDFTGTRTVMAEDELRIPLLVHEGRQIYFRAKIDRLYQRLDDPDVFVHVDYKSSRTAKSEKQVHDDLQMWGYNWAIHEFYPEIGDLRQFYDQLRYGQVPTAKSDAQRAEFRDWLVETVIAIIEDDELGDDGLGLPRFNEWCPWCGLMESCSVVPKLSAFALTRIAELSPQRPKLKKNGEPSKVLQTVPLEVSRLDEYAAALADAGRARQVLDRFDESVKGLLKSVSDERRSELGYRLKPRSASTFTPDAMKVLHEQTGDRFYELCKLTKTGLQSGLVQDVDLLGWALSLAESTAGTESVVPVGD